MKRITAPILSVILAGLDPQPSNGSNEWRIPQGMNRSRP